MQHRTVLCTLCAVGLSLFVLSRTVWGPRPVQAAEAGAPLPAVSAACNDPLESEAAWRHRTCQPRHWRYIMLKR